MHKPGSSVDYPVVWVTPFKSSFILRISIVICLGCEVLSQLTSADYAKLIKLIQHAILSTDLAIYFQKRQSFFDVMNGKKKDWTNEEHRELLR